MSNHASMETEDRIRQVQTENELLLAQLHDAQEALERQALMNERSRTHADTVLRSLPGSSAGRCRCLTFMHRLTDRLGLTIHRRVAFIDQSGCFDHAWYLARYPDVAESGKDPVEHYLRHGAAEKRNPGPAFDTAWYLERYPDVARSGMNPLYHYIRLGRAEGRQPAPDQPPGGDISRVALALRALTAQIAEQAQQIEALERVRDELTALSDSRRDQIDTLQQALAAERERLQHALADTEGERDAAREQAQERQTTVQRLEQERAELEQQLFAAQTQIETLIQTRDQHAALADQRQAEIDALTQVRAAIEAEKASLVAQREQFEHALAMATREQEEHQRRMAQESAQAEQRLAELKRWLLDEAQA